MSNYHPLVYQIRQRLENANISYEFFEHEAVRTSQEAQKTRPGYSLKQGAKAIIISAKIRLENDYIRKLFMLVMPANQKLNGKAAKKILAAKSISFATKEEANFVTKGVEFGGVPPFGDMFGLDVFVDESLLENKRIVFNCGDRRASIAMNTSDYLDLLSPTIASFSS